MRNSSLIKLICLILSVFMAISLLGACSKTDNETAKNSSGSSDVEGSDDSSDNSSDDSSDDEYSDDEYSEDEYDTTKLHAAMRLAIKMIESPDATKMNAAEKAVDVNIEKKRRAAGVDGWGRTEYEHYYVVKVNGKKGYQSNDNPTKLIKSIMNV